MKNKVLLKKYLKKELIFITLVILLFVLISTLEFKISSNIFNEKINNILSTVKQKYPNVSSDEIIEIITNEKGNDNILSQYSVDIKNESIIKKYNQVNSLFRVINVFFLSLSFASIIVIFLKYNRKKDEEIVRISKYINEINNNNYSFEIDKVSEDELSILKNEIYKTTIMLKEVAANSVKDKETLKENISNISHQLKTPLASILIMLDNMISDSKMDNDTRLSFLLDIKKNINSLNSLTSSLLKLSQLDTNSVVLKKEKASLFELLNSVKNELLPLCDLKDVQIIIDIPDNLEINCDVFWENEALKNIIKNCVEHSYEKGEIVIKAISNNLFTEVTIKDNGVGIKSRDLPHIFERFYKGENSSSSSIGIGLALAKNIIEKDGGVITVDSKESKGTTFCVKYFK